VPWEARALIVARPGRPADAEAIGANVVGRAGIPVVARCSVGLEDACAAHQGVTRTGLVAIHGLEAGADLDRVLDERATLHVLACRCQRRPAPEEDRERLPHRTSIPPRAGCRERASHHGITASRRPRLSKAQIDGVCRARTSQATQPCASSPMMVGTTSATSRASTPR
jgi:hypothetical protein